MSKEEIMLEYEPKDDAGVYDDEQIKSMMEEYAQQQAVLFAEWMIRAGWSPIVTSIPGPPVFVHEDSDQRLSLSDLYNLFLLKKQ